MDLSAFRPPSDISIHQQHLCSLIRLLLWFTKNLKSLVQPVFSSIDYFDHMAGYSGTDLALESCLSTAIVFDFVGVGEKEGIIF